MNIFRQTILIITLIVITPSFGSENVSAVQQRASTEPLQNTFNGCENIEEISSGECEALVALYNSTNGQEWTTNDNWLVTNTPCSWSGITCNIESVTSIFLRSNQLSGAIPQQIGNLTDLTSLTLDSNQLSGAIPSEIGSLTNLTRLHLYSNRLSGALPSEIGNLTNLTNLDLYSNQLSGAIPPEVGNLTNLTQLNLFSNQLSGAIPPEVGSLTNLNSLRLSDNQLSGAIPTEIGSLTNLTQLNLFSNQLSGVIPSAISNLRSLALLYLSDNLLSGTIPPGISNLSNLNQLDLSDNQLSGNIPSEIGDFSTLTILNLSDNQLDGTIPSAIGNLNNLIRLGISGNHLSGTIPQEIGNLNNLTQLNLCDNQLSGSIPSQINNITNLTQLLLCNNRLIGAIPQELGNNINLAYLWLDGNQLSGAIPPEIGNLFNLVNLQFYDNQLTGAIPAEIGNLTSLTALSLSDNKFSGAIPAEIGNLVSLTSLSITDENFSGPIPSELGNLSKLTTLDIQGTQLNGNIPAALGQLSKLRTLVLDDNQFSGDIPVEFGNLSNLKTLSMQNNQLTGVLPNAIGRLTNLRSLALNNNSLNGPIPAELGDLSSLKQLKLGFNQLTGNIPAELGQLGNLNELQLSANQLVGEIPSELSNLTNLSSLDLKFNRIYTNDEALRQYLTEKDSDWSTDQLFTPNKPDATAESAWTVKLTWEDAEDETSLVYYEFSYATAVEGPYTIYEGRKVDTTNTDFTLRGLEPTTTYFIRMRTYADIYSQGQPERIGSAYTSAFEVQTLSPSPEQVMTATAVAAATPTPSRTATPTPVFTITPTGQENSTPDDGTDTPIATSVPLSATTPPATTPSTTTTSAPEVPPDTLAVDPYEVNNQCDQATEIDSDGRSQRHGFLLQGDEDWLQFDTVAGEIYRIEVQSPYDSRADVNLEIYPDCVNEPTKIWAESFTPGVRLDFEATTASTVYLYLSDTNPSTFGTDVFYDISVRPLQNNQVNGAVIILGGRYKAPDRVQPNIDNVTDAVYSLFSDNRYSDDEIFYMSTDPNREGYDEPATNENLRKAITQWAVDKVGEGQPLTLYLMDHGGIDEFYIDRINEEILDPDDLNDWLTELEDKVPGLSVNVIIEACHSGSFIKRAKSISKPRRLVISSTNEQNLAYASSDGALFSDRFLTLLREGYSFYHSFWEAKNVVQKLNFLQEPWIDANGDGVTDQYSDQYDVEDHEAGTDRLDADTWAPYIVSAQGPTIAEIQDDATGVIRAEVRDNKSVKRVWAAVYAPSYTPPANANELVPENVPILELQLEGDQSEGGGFFSVEYDKFNEEGEYRIAIYAEDDDGLKARLMVLKVPDEGVGGTEVLGEFREYLPIIKQ